MINDSVFNYIYKIYNTKSNILTVKSLTTEGFEPSQFALSELESDPLDHSGILSLIANYKNYSINNH